MLEFAYTLIFLGADINIGELIIVLTATRLAFLLPIPGGLGSLEAALVWSLTSMGYASATGVSVSLFIRVRDVVLAGLGLAIGGKWRSG